MQRLPLIVSLAVAALFVAYLGFVFGLRPVLLFAIGTAIGLVLYRCEFGFSAAYRRLILERDTTDVVAHLAMLAAATVLFAPVLASGEIFGQRVGGAAAPVSVSSVFGAFIFGIGMQLGGGCASGTLYAAGGGSVRMVVVLLFFCVGGFWATLDMAWWRDLPGIGTIVLGERVGWLAAAALQVGALAGIYAVLRVAGGRLKRPLWDRGIDVARGRWPLLLGALALAVLNLATLATAGHPWAITWGFTLWAAKVTTLLGWTPASTDFWRDGFPHQALSAPVLSDVTSVMNIGILVGAFAAAALAGRIAPRMRLPLGSLAAAAIGGLLLGYGARLAYGCNIGAFFSGIASTSLHGWTWIVAALLGNVVGVRLRPAFRLAN